MRRFFLAVLVFLCIFCNLTYSYPVAPVVPEAWLLDFKYRDIRKITVDIPGEGRKSFYYMVYTVTNNTGQDIYFKPEFTIVTDKFEVIPALLDVDPAVFKAIERLYKPLYPWLEHPVRIIGPILQGRDNARDSVAIWPDPGGDIKSFDVYIAGLSGEITKVKNPLYKKDSTDKSGPEYFVLRRTLKIHYILLSDTQKNGRREIIKKDESWVMR